MERKENGRVRNIRKKEVKDALQMIPRYLTEMLINT